MEQIRPPVEATTVTSAHAAFRVTMTFGVSQIKPGEAINQCIDHADETLYAGKRAGRNRVVPQPDMVGT